MLNGSASLAILQVFSKSCLVNLISKDTNQVFSMYHQMKKLMSSFILNGRKKVSSCLISYFTDSLDQHVKIWQSFQLTRAHQILVFMEVHVSMSLTATTANVQRISLVTDVRLPLDTVTMTTLAKMVLFVKIIQKVSRVMFCHLKLSQGHWGKVYILKLSQGQWGSKFTF